MSDFKGCGLYVIGGDKSAVKIGKVQAPLGSWVGIENQFYEACLRRLKQLQTGNPHELRLLFASPHLQEAAAHDYFSRWRVRGEWFTREVVPTFNKWMPIPQPAFTSYGGWRLDCTVQYYVVADDTPVAVTTVRKYAKPLTEILARQGIPWDQLAVHKVDTSRLRQTSN